MKKLSEMTAEQLVGWMDKTVATLTKREYQTQNGREVMARFDKLKDFFIQCGVWAEYCELNGLDVDCDSDDFFS